ncbi:rhodanese-like domain-containing protein [Effusibacillus dendaii]|uniref:Sulfurtransferase n=1 Tax=Effusibacillus dendaii TaxID=2743772 RepID=A0A7I8DE25_9BACL|nr:rhodanese-like domain-containing protein [Effusibacillus dendaii]BCJ88277.1 sulfurtransferase [Effusibacillus dendaii]
MVWLQYLIFAVVVLLLIKKFLPVKGLENLTPRELEQLLESPKGSQFIDVREKHEFTGGHIKGFKNIPLSEFSKRVQEMDRNSRVVLTCQSGMRSRRAASILKKNGFQSISHLKSGVSGWHSSFVKGNK